MNQLRHASWTKSSFSSGGSECVEVAAVPAREACLTNKSAEDFAIVVRDSKNPSDSHLSFTRAEWDAFVAAVKAGEFDTPRLLAVETAGVAAS